MGKVNSVSKYIDCLPKNATVIPVEILDGAVRHEETISCWATKDLLGYLQGIGDDARVIGVQRLETQERTQKYSNLALAKPSATEITLNSFVVEVTVWKDKHGRRKSFTTDGLHKVQGAFAALTKNPDIKINLTILVRVVFLDNILRRWAAGFDSPDSARTCSDRIITVFSPIVKKEGKMAHIRLLNSANVNIISGCPGQEWEKKWNKLGECDPHFPRQKIVGLKSLEYIRDHDMDTLRWFCLNFPINKTKKVFLDVGVVTALILSYKWELARGGNPARIVHIWDRYLSGDRLDQDGFSGLEKLRQSIKNKEGGHGTHSNQNEHFQMALFGFNKAYNFDKFGGTTYVKGSIRNKIGKMPIVISRKSA